MSSNSYVLDTSAIMTLIENEEGADRVEAIIASRGALLPFVVLLEVHYLSHRECGEDEANRRYAFLRRLPVKHLWEINEPLLITASRLKASYSISLADAIVAAFAVVTNSLLVHKDPELDALAGEVPLERLPYKPKIR